MAALLFGVSTLHCVTVSLAGEQLACRMLTDAGFTQVDVLPAPGDPGDAIYLARR